MRRINNKHSAKLTGTAPQRGQPRFNETGRLRARNVGQTSGTQRNNASIGTARIVHHGLRRPLLERSCDQANGCGPLAQTILAGNATRRDQDIAKAAKDFNRHFHRNPQEAASLFKQGYFTQHMTSNAHEDIAVLQDILTHPNFHVVAGRRSIHNMVNGKIDSDVEGSVQENEKQADNEQADAIEKLEALKSLFDSSTDKTGRDETKEQHLETIQHGRELEDLELERYGAAHDLAAHPRPHPTLVPPRVRAEAVEAHRGLLFGSLTTSQSSEGLFSLYERLRHSEREDSLLPGKGEAGARDKDVGSTTLHQVQTQIEALATTAARDPKLRDAHWLKLQIKNYGGEGAEGIYARTYLLTLARDIETDPDIQASHLPSWIQEIIKHLEARDILSLIEILKDLMIDPSASKAFQLLIREAFDVAVGKKLDLQKNVGRKRSGIQAVEGEGVKVSRRKLDGPARGRS